MAVVLREEVSLLDLQLGEVVVAYVEHLEREGELELEVATEFLVLIAALLELKSRLMLPGPEDELDDLSPEEAVEELLARMLEYRRYRDASTVLADRFESQRGYLYRSAPLPAELRRVAVDAATAVYDPDALGAALGDLLTEPPDVDISHIRPTVSLERRLRALRDVLRRRSSFDFDEEFGGEDRLTQAVTVFGLLELYRKGEITWEQDRAVRPDPGQEDVPARRQGRMSDLSRTSKRCSSSRRSRSPSPTWRGDRGDRGPGRRGDRAAARGPRRGQARDRPARGLRRLQPWPAIPASEDAARRLLSKPRTPPLTQAQAETLAIVAYLQPVSRPEIARIRGVTSESAVQTLAERGLIEESGRSRFGAAIFKTSELFERLFGLSGLDQLPDPSRFDPSPEDAARAARAAAQGRGTARRAVSGGSRGRPPPQQQRGGCPEGASPTPLS